MKHRTCCLNFQAGVVADVHTFADQRMAEFGHVDSNLMLTSGFKAAFNQRGAHKLSNRCDVRNRTLRRDRNLARRTPEMSIRAAHSVATIHNEICLHMRRGDSTVRNGVVDAIDRVLAELRRQRALRVSRAREHNQAARVLVETVNDAQLGIDALALSSKHRSSVVDEGVLVPCFVRDAEHRDRLVDDHDVPVKKHDRTLGSGPVRSLGAPWSTMTTVPGATRNAGSTQRRPFTVTRPSVQRPRARDHATPVCWRTTAATVGSSDFMSTECCAARLGRGASFSPTVQAP